MKFLNLAMDLPTAQCTCIYWLHFQGVILLNIILEACYQRDVFSFCEYVTWYSKPKLHVNLFRFSNAFVHLFVIALIIVHVYTYIQYVKQSQIYCHKIFKALNISAYFVLISYDS